MFNSPDYSKLTRAFHSFVEDKPYLFNFNSGVVSINEYLDFVTKRQPYLKCFYIPIAYSLDVLDQFKDKVVCTSYTVGPMGRQFYTIFQIDEKTHILATYSLDEDKFAVILDFMVDDSAFFSDFLKNNKTFAMHPIDVQPVGFKGFGA